MQTQVKEEASSTSNTQFTRKVDAESGFSSITRPPSHPDRDETTEERKLPQMNAELKRSLRDEKALRLELEAENDKLHKAQIQLQEQNSKLQQDCQLWNDRAVKVRHSYRALQVEFQSLQERYEEKCRQLHECEKQHPQQERMKHVKQEHVADLQQPLQLQAGRRGRVDAVNSSIEVGTGVASEVPPAVAAHSDMVSNEHVKQEALAGDEADDGEAGEEKKDDDSKSSDGEYGGGDGGEDGSDSGDEDSGERPSKRYVPVH
jgi:predicted RNase H-like nuclease (RuvC/YqgF family)